ncbi:single-stranded DNA-binding protein [Merdibacter massiliensis]|uniref:single-stranded DNA-binding protein n=1 Tax=Merdibacter massiliensis TaxID=1871030 RepID=UPI00096AC768|nr:single-stranded DNA-binding protein [Merdibacter massiliensis]
MINRVVLVGRLTRDPELRKTASNASVVSFTVACDRRYKTQGQPDADFISCVAWNKVADLMVQYLHKGSLVGVEGRIQTRNYDDANGRRVYVTEVVADSVQFLEPKGAGNAQSNYQQPSYQQPNYQQPSYSAPNGGYTANNGYQQNEVNSDSFSNDFDAGDTLDIASDDLPF